MLTHLYGILFSASNTATTKTLANCLCCILHQLAVVKAAGLDTSYCLIPIPHPPFAPQCHPIMAARLFRPDLSAAIAATDDLHFLQCCTFLLLTDFLVTVRIHRSHSDSLCTRFRLMRSGLALSFANRCCAAGTRSMFRPSDCIVPKKETERKHFFASQQSFLATICKRNKNQYNAFMKPDHEHATIIELLGDSAELARILSAKEVASGRKPVSRQTVQGWKKRGFPAKIQLRYQTMIRKAEKSLKEQQCQQK